MAHHDFHGFGKPAASFLRDLAANNDRTWFNAHKHLYQQHIVTPAFTFIEAMAPLLAAISPHFCAITGKQGGSLMRVYRDTRFGHNKDPYKTNIGIQFRHELGKDVHAPGYYVHFQPPGISADHGPGGSFLGVGMWRPDRDALEQTRQRMSKYPDEWIAARDSKAFQNHFKLEGDSLKRPPRGFDPEHSCIKDLKRKDFIATMPLTLKDASGSGLVERAAQAFADATRSCVFCAGPFTYRSNTVQSKPDAGGEIITHRNRQHMAACLSVLEHA